MTRGKENSRRQAVGHPKGNDEMHRAKCVNVQESSQRRERKERLQEGMKGEDRERMM